MTEISRKRWKWFSLMGGLLAASSLSVFTAGRSVAGNSNVSLPQQNSSAPNIQVLVMSGIGGHDILNVTYASQTSSANISQDLATLSQNISIESAAAQVSNSAEQVPGMGTPILTSVTVPAQGLIPLNGEYLPVAPLVMGLERYQRIEITFIMPPSYTYSGVTHYTDKNVTIDCTGSGSTYTFNVVVAGTGRFTFELPQPISVVDADRTHELELYDENKAENRRRVFGVIIIITFAILVGLLVFAVTRRLQRQSS